MSCNDNITRHQYDIHNLYSVSTFSLLVSDSCIDNDLLFLILILIVLVVETLLLIFFLQLVPQALLRVMFAGPYKVSEPVLIR